MELRRHHDGHTRRTLLATLWRDPTLSTRQIAARLGIAFFSVKVAAAKQRLGPRPGAARRQPVVRLSSFWTAERDAILTRMLANGCTYSEIDREVGRTSAVKGQSARDRARRLKREANRIAAE